MDKELKLQLELMSKSMRKTIIDMAYNSGGNAHLGGGLSEVEILAVLYGAVMNHNPENPKWEQRDRFILSKGHGVLGYYAALFEKGYFSREKLLTFQQNGTDLGAHPVMNIDIGIESSNGSLGQGMSFCVGMGLYAKLKNHAYKIYTLLGNGECNEGSVWEAAMSASQYKLDNIFAVIDNNLLQSDGNSSDIMSAEPIADKFRSFNWNAIEADGHDVGALYDAFTATYQKGKPTVIIAKTSKGKGFSFMENKPEWHHNRLTKSLYEQALVELGAIK